MVWGNIVGRWEGVRGRGWTKKFVWRKIFYVEFINSSKKDLDSWEGILELGELGKEDGRRNPS